MRDWLQRIAERCADVGPIAHAEDRDLWPVYAAIQAAAEHDLEAQKAGHPVSVSVLQSIRDICTNEIEGHCRTRLDGCDDCRELGELECMAMGALLELGDSAAGGPPRVPSPDMLDALDACECEEPICVAVSVGDECITKQRSRN